MRRIVLPVYAGYYHPGYTPPCILPGTPLLYPALLHCPTRRCRESPLTALERGVTELTVRDEGVTVAGITNTRFTVGQEFSVCSGSPLFLLWLRSMLRRLFPHHHPFHCWRTLFVRPGNPTFSPECGNQAAITLGYGHASNHPFHCP